MHTHTATRHLHNLFAYAAKAAAYVAGRATSVCRTMNVDMPSTRHRMGSWEESASFRARALRNAAVTDSAGGARKPPTPPAG